MMNKITQFTSHGLIGSLRRINICRRFFLCVCFCCLFCAIKTDGQYLKGITNITDTSYTTYSAFKGTLKEHPDITIVKEFTFPDIIEKRGITYRTLNHRELKIDAFFPKNNHQTMHPAFIMIHGGGWRSGNRSQHYPLAQSLAHLGYVCFTPEYRLSTEALFPACIYDIKAAIRWVKSNAGAFHIDTSKIVIAGFSAGGELAAFMGTTANMPLFEGSNDNVHIGSNVAAVVDIDGTLSFVHREGREGEDNDKISAATLWFGYSKKQNKVLWQAASPLSYVSWLTPPTLFINSSLPWMHAGRQDYIDSLNRYNIYSEVHSFDNAPHSFCLFNPWFQPTVQYIDEFLKKVFHL